MKQLTVLLLLCLACGSDAVRPDERNADIALQLPAPGATGVSVATTITVRFSSTVALPLDTARVFWLESGGQRIAASISAPDAVTLMLTPADILDPATRYTVQLGAGAAQQGTPLAPRSWTFTTGGGNAPSVDSASILTHLRVLADDSMRGRKAGSADELKAATYIRDEFARVGLVPLQSPQWFQTVPPDGFTGSSQNVIGVIAGAGALAQKWVVIGAHYDHVGIRNGAVYNGADDNASGTAALLELARQLARHSASGGFGSEDRRSIMLVAFGAEEAGMVGSSRLCRWEPLIPVSSVNAMLNLDMIGRLRDNKVYIEGFATAVEWPHLLNRYEPGLAYYSASINSDQRCYSLAGRPVLALHTGLHPEYHTPADDVDLINVGGLNVVANLALKLAINLTVRPDLAK